MRTVQQILQLILRFSHDAWGLLAALDGYYECPKGEAGERLGPLVGYAGHYGEQNLHYVGDVYANFAVAEEEPEVLGHYVNQIMNNVLGRIPRKDIDVFCGAPMGGITLAYELARREGKRFIFSEKKVTAVATPNSREESKLTFLRHKVRQGERVVICEDVLNNFSTTAMLIKLIEEAGGEVIAILALLNRSTIFNQVYDYNGRSIPVMAMVRKRIEEYHQDDLAVAADVAAGNVVWKPKDEWEKLKAAVSAAAAQ